MQLKHKNNLINVKKQKISKKIDLIFINILNLTLITMIISIGVLLFTSSRTSALYEGPFLLSKTISNIRLNLQESDKNIYRAVVQTDTINKNIFLKNSDNSANELKADIEILRNISTIDGSLINELTTNIDLTEKLRVELIDLIKNSDTEKEIEEKQNEYGFQMDICDDFIDKLYDSSQESALSFVNSSVFYRNIAISALIILMIFLIIIPRLMGKSLKSTLISGINNVTTIANNIVNGNLDVENNYISTDEMGQMSEALIKSINMIKSYIADITVTLENLSLGNLNISTNSSVEYIGDFIPIHTALNKIIEQLNISFSDMHNSIDFTANSAKEISSITKVLSDGASNQASAIQQLQASFSEISEKVNLNSGNSEQAYCSYIRTKEIIENGNNQVNILLHSILDISISSKQISQIISTIEDIAEQTNLLSLNAAIEAAKAGESGKSFAIVADEIKGLSEQSSNAVNKITKIIESSLKLINNVEILAKDTNITLNDVVKNVDSTSALINEITAASKDQADAISQMTSGIDVISDIIQNNLATAEETAASTETLSEQSQIIRNKISLYKLKF